MSEIEPVKEGDIISFKKKNIMYIPIDYNSKDTALRKYIQREIKYKPSINPEVTDWNGSILNSKARDYIVPGCTVRIQFKVYNENDNSRCGHIYYVKVLEKNDNILFGKLLPIYKPDPKGMDWLIGYYIKFLKESICEIPLGENWNPDLKIPSSYISDFGYFTTGSREATFVDL